MISQFTAYINGNAVAANPGARCTGSGLLHMEKRAEGDSILAERLGLRKDIPRNLFQQLIERHGADAPVILDRRKTPRVTPRPSG